MATKGAVEEFAQAIKSFFAMGNKAELMDLIVSVRQDIPTSSVVTRGKVTAYKEEKEQAVEYFRSLATQERRLAARIPTLR